MGVMLAALQSKLYSAKVPPADGMCLCLSGTEGNQQGLLAKKSQIVPAGNLAVTMYRQPADAYLHHCHLQTGQFQCT